MFCPSLLSLPLSALLAQRWMLLSPDVTVNEQLLLCHPAASLLAVALTTVTLIPTTNVPGKQGVWAYPLTSLFSWCVDALVCVSLWSDLYCYFSKWRWADLSSGEVHVSVGYWLCSNKPGKLVRSQSGRGLACIEMCLQQGCNRPRRGHCIGSPIPDQRNCELMSANDLHIGLWLQKRWMLNAKACGSSAFCTEGMEKGGFEGWRCRVILA